MSDCRAPAEGAVQRVPAAGLVRRIKHLAVDEGASLSALVERALTAYADAEEAS